jgi:hypothetical protein
MKLSSALVLINLTATAGFTTHQSTAFVRKHERNIVALDAAPTMVIY